MVVLNILLAVTVAKIVSPAHCTEARTFYKIRYNCTEDLFEHDMPGVMGRKFVVEISFIQRRFDGNWIVM